MIPANLDELLKLAKGTRFESAAADDRKLEELLLDEMQASDDPMTREIGAGIAGGTMTWRSVATDAAYADYFEQSVTAMRQFDFGAEFDAMASERDANERRVAEAAERDDAEPVSRGVLKRRR